MARLARTPLRGAGRHARNPPAQPVPHRHAQAVPGGFWPVSQAEPSVPDQARSYC